MLSALPGWLARAAVIAWILSALVRSSARMSPPARCVSCAGASVGAGAGARPQVHGLDLRSTVATEVLLTLNGFVQAALVLAWIVVRRRIRARADTSDVTFIAGQYQLSMRPSPRSVPPRQPGLPAHAHTPRLTNDEDRTRARAACREHSSVAHLTAEAYDLLEWHQGAAFCVAGIAVGLIASAALGTDIPLLLHTVVASLQLWRHPLVGVYLRQQHVVRPWNSFNPFL